MATREIEKIIDYNGHKIKIKKFNPLDGCYLAQQILTSLLPPSMEAGLGLNRPFNPSKSMSKSDFNDLMIACMRHCFYVSPKHGEIDMMQEDGNIPKSDLFTFEDIFILTAEVLLFNSLGFFEEGRAEHIKAMVMSFVGTMKTLAPQTEA